MQKVEIRTMVKKTELVESPKLSSKVREYLWQYIFDDLLVQKKVMTDEKYNYSVTLDKSELDELKKGLDYEYINSFNYPATIEECKFFMF
jgi:hypothetical protein